MKSRHWAVGCALATAVGLGPLAAAGQTLHIPDSLPPGVTEEMARRGQVVFEGGGQCFACHGAHAQGRIGPNLTDPNWWRAGGSYLALIQQILSGVPEAQSRSGIAMAPRGGSNIGDHDVQAVAAYVWSLSHPHVGDSLPAMVTGDLIRRGRAVFAGPGGCTACHGEDATGAVGPNLTDQEWLHARVGYLSILQRVLMGVEGTESRTGLSMPARGGSSISDADVYAVAAYVWVLSRQSR